MKQHPPTHTCARAKDKALTTMGKKLTRGPAAAASVCFSSPFTGDVNGDQTEGLISDGHT